MKKKYIIITGVAGMIGSELLEKIIYKKNYFIYGMDNFVLGKKKFIKKFEKKKNFKFFKIDISKKIPDRILKKINNNISEIWLLAANSDINLGNKNEKIDYVNTFLSAKNTFESLEPKIKSHTKVIFTSSSAIYGTVKKKIDENFLNFKPETNYGLMKLFCENYLLYKYSKLNFMLNIFRFPNVVGENLTHGIIYDFLKKKKSKNKVFQVLGNGNQQKPYSYSKEVIDAMLFVSSLNKKQVTVNLGYGDNGIKVKKIVKLFNEYFNLSKDIKYQKKLRGWDGDIPKYSYSTKKLKKLGYTFKKDSLNSLKTCLSNIK